MLFKRKDENLYSIGNIDIDAYVMVPESKLKIVQYIISFFDGEHSIEWIENHVHDVKDIKTNVYRLYDKFSKRGLIVDPKPEVIERGEFRDHTVDLLSIDLKNFYKIFNFSDRKWEVFLGATGGIIIVGLLLLFLNFDIILTPTPYLFYDSYLFGVLLLVPFIVISLLCHELGHAIAASKYGLKPKKFSFGLYFWSGVPYLEIPGIYTLKEKYRINVWLAGIYMNLFIFSVIAFFLFLVDTSTFWNQILWKVAIANLFAVVGNLIPFLPTDGCFLLTMILKTPNIRTNAFKSIRQGTTNFKTRFVFLGFLFFIIMWLMFAAFMITNWIYKIFSEIYILLPFDKSINIFIISLMFILPLAFILLQYWKKYKLLKKKQKWNAT
ncbi:MAG: hypothetical protein CVU88_04640 [Firmicutes bacterium HGW-Firmicutes-13]|nr:MAG: hypothetical protein CVU88_04640 [Firmicutes bacterium HGW-Firmicutes-13]